MSLDSIVDTDTGEPTKVDHGALMTIDIVHHEIHEGLHFFGSYSAVKNAGETLDIHIVTPNSIRRMHLMAEVSAQGSGVMIWNSGVLTSDNGTALGILNSNRNSSKTTTLLAYHTPTVTNAGTTLITKIVGAGGAQKLGGSNSQRDEIILKANTKYLLRFTSDGNSNTIAWNFSFYERDAD